MNYFTRERFLALQSTDPQTMNSADAAWEAAVEEYDAHLDAIRPKLPETVRTLLDGYFLNGAQILSLGQDRLHFVVTLQLESPPRELLTLRYQLTRPPQVHKEPFPGMNLQGEPRWVCDEMSVPEAGAAHYQHAILLTNGWEIVLRFDQLSVESVASVYPDRVPQGEGWPATLTTMP